VKIPVLFARQIAPMPVFDRQQTIISQLLLRICVGLHGHTVYQFSTEISNKL